MMRSKKKRQQKGIPEPEKDAKPGAPAVIGQVTIDVYGNMDVTVRNFPTDHGVAMMILCNAMMKVSEFFVKEGLKPKSPIVLAKPGMSIADLDKISKNN